MTPPQPPRPHPSAAAPVARAVPAARPAAPAPAGPRPSPERPGRGAQPLPRPGRAAAPRPAAPSRGAGQAPGATAPRRAGAAARLLPVVPSPLGRPGYRLRCRAGAARRRRAAARRPAGPAPGARARRLTTAAAWATRARSPSRPSAARCWTATATRWRSRSRPRTSTPSRRPSPRRSASRRRPSPATRRASRQAVAPLLGLAAVDGHREAQARTRSSSTSSAGVDPALGKKVMALELPGIGHERDDACGSTPSRDLAAGVLGFTDFDGIGKAGIELALSDVLAGKDGKTVARFDAPAGSSRRAATATSTRCPVQDVELTLDRDLQWYAQKLIAEQVKATQARNGTRRGAGREDRRGARPGHRPDLRPRQPHRGRAHGQPGPQRRLRAGLGQQGHHRGRRPHRRHRHPATPSSRCPTTYKVSEQDPARRRGPTASST